MFYTPSMRVAYREEPCRSALNRVSGMPFRWSLNPYMGCVHRCTFCYVRGFEARADRPSGDDYGRSIRVKVNVATVLRAELARTSWACEEVTIGAATDPYQPAEGRYRLTRECLVALCEADTPVSVITRGPLVVRDLDVLAAAARRAGVRVNVSIPTLDDAVWRSTEPGTSPPMRRMDVVRRLADAGIPVAVAIAPILPGLSDTRESLAAVVRAARDAGAMSIWASMLNLRPGTREHYLDALERDWPELRPLYDDLYGTLTYLPSAAAQPTLATVQDLKRRHRGRPTRPPIRPSVEGSGRQLTLAV